jgi:hypothetical protein
MTFAAARPAQVNDVKNDVLHGIAVSGLLLQLT